MKPRQQFEEQVFFSTVRITIQNKSNSTTSCGTGFLFRAYVRDNQQVILLVSNKHVYKDPNNSIILNFHKRHPSDPETPLLGQTITLSDKQFTNVYHEHPNQNIDLACINISKISEPATGIYYKTLSPDNLCDYNDEELLPGSSVWFVGYPENRFDTEHNLPILRRGYVASIPRIDFQKQPQLLIDAQVFPGSSGSPVFVTLKGNFRLLGVVTQTMIRNQKLQTVPTATAIGVQQVLGLGIVLKSHLVHELVNFVVANISRQIAENMSEPLERASSYPQ